MQFLLPAGVARRFASLAPRQAEVGLCQRPSSHATRRVTSRWASSAYGLLRIGIIGLCCSAGCKDDSQTIRKIQTGRQVRQQAETKVDQLAEAFSLVSRLIELQPEPAARQITYHLNSWQQSQGAVGSSAASDRVESADATKLRELLYTVSEVLPTVEATEAISRAAFDASDVESLRYRYLVRQVSEWVRARGTTDPLWANWVDERREVLGEDSADSLALAIRLFDWTVRNIALEPDELVGPTPPSPPLPMGMRLRGPGYRQTPLQTLFRGVGDGLQRAGVFVALCRQVDLPACLLATPPVGDGTMRPWAVGVLIGGEVYLFDCRLAVPVVGPNQAGVATLAQARSDATVLRRMNVPGWFEYPLQMADIQQCVALLMLDPESMSLRAKRLQGALTGDLRLGVYDDPVSLAEQFEAISGIASARIWDIPLLARVYRGAIEDATQQDPLLAFFIKAPWMILESPAGQSQELALGRWRHLQGRFESADEEALPGAKRLYLSQRQPEFEISDLRGDVELQLRYGIRRELGVTPEQYDMQIQQIQALMRQGKVTASFWLSLIQYESERFDLARNWFDQRVMAEGLDSIWKIAARYNLARTFERLGESERAAEIYRIEGDPQEHGNRIRARLITRGQSRSGEEL
jgi:hypothetical protein